MSDYLRCENTPALETPRLLMRPPVPTDAPDLAEWLGLDEVYTYWGRKASGGEKNPASLFIDPRPHVKRKPSQDFKWGVVWKDSGKVIGMLEIFNVQNQRMAYVGYRLHPAYWRQGLVTEALRCAVDFVFANTELMRLEATADVKNIASLRVLEKCGFVREGTVRQGKMGSRYCDYAIFGLLQEDWEGLGGSCPQ